METPERADTKRENTPRGEDAARLNDLNPDLNDDPNNLGHAESPVDDSQQTATDSSSKKPGAGRDPKNQAPQGNPPKTRPSEPQERRDGEMQPDDTSRDGDPSFVSSGVSNGGREGKYGEDEYKGRRNE
jgi:hypothetical protein